MNESRKPKRNTSKSSRIQRNCSPAKSTDSQRSGKGIRRNPSRLSDTTSSQGKLAEGHSMHFGDTSGTSNRLREMLGPPPVKKRGLAPRWMVQSVKQAVKEGRIRKLQTAPVNPVMMLQEGADQFGSSWLDHVGKFTFDGIEFLVSEPYAERINRQMLTELEAFTQAIGTDYVFTANSEHFPAHGQNRDRPHACRYTCISPLRVRNRNDHVPVTTRIRFSGRSQA